MRWAKDCESLVLTRAWSIEMYANQIAVIDCCERFDMSSPLPNSQETKRIAGVIVTHGHLAGELLAAAEMIVGPISFITAVSIGWHDDVDGARDEVQRAITRVSQGAGVLLLTDMFGGTPTNIASMFLEEGAVEVVTGVNLPMVIKLASSSTEDPLAEIARKICDQDRKSVV